MTVEKRSRYRIAFYEKLFHWNTRLYGGSRFDSELVSRAVSSFR